MICATALACALIVAAAAPGDGMAMVQREPKESWLLDYGQLEYRDTAGVWHAQAAVIVVGCSPADSAGVPEDGWCLYMANEESRFDRVRGIRPTSPRLEGWAQFQGKPFLVYSDALRRWTRP